MKALVAYTRLLNGQRHVGFEVRSMTCFNGFNSESAFTPKPNSVIDVSVNLAYMGSEACTVRPSEARDTLWECIGMGWLSNNVVAGEAFSAMLSSPPNYAGNREQLTSMLNIEHITNRVISMSSYSWVSGTRVLTEHEVWIGDALAQLKAAAVGSIPQSEAIRLSGSLMYCAVHLNQYHQWCLYDFVGSERPSGAAVSYLQVYRNTSQNILNVNNNVKLQSVAALLACIDPGGQHYKTTFKSFMPILSNLFNAGGDSDIFSFADSPFVALQAMRFGTFSLSNFYLDSRPMTTEGRYAKGQQSIKLAEKVARAARERQLIPSNFTNGVKKAWEIQQAFVAAFSPLQFFSRSLHRQSVDIESALAIARRDLPAPETVGVHLRASLVRMTDLNIPLVPVSPTVTEATARSAGAAAGFQVWVSQNDELDAPV